MTRKLTDEERALWERLSETVQPLSKKKMAKARPSAAAVTAPRKPKSVSETRAKRPASSPKVNVSAPAKRPPALAPLQERTRRRLVRGLVEIDARIDLHGMRQERAFARLQTFLHHAQARGHRVVLVVTGKGNGEGRGVLRQSVPAWLARPDLRHLVVGFEPAGRRHGGDGALYVRVRRRREARRVSTSRL